MNELNKYKGCLIGGAIGDAFGYVIEFYSYKEILKKYGSKGLINMIDINGKYLISDDTQMTLFTATGLLQNRLDNNSKNYIEDIYINYIEWLKTQIDYLNDKTECNSWLMNIDELYNRRAPGNTCLDALLSGKMGTMENPINNSKGCGGVMRVAPIGLFFKDSPLNEIGLLSAKSSAITHGHPLGYIPSYMLAILIRLLCDGENLINAIYKSLEYTLDYFGDNEYIYDFNNIIIKAINLSNENINDCDSITQIGEGWVAEETLAIAIYCALKYQNNFEKGIIAAVNHSGDSDSTVAVLGNILGAYLGYDNIPKHLYDKLEIKEVIEEIADDLYYSNQEDNYFDNKMVDKYIKFVYNGYDNNI